MDPVHVIVNADDLGYHARRDDAIIHAFQNGVVTSASLMVNGFAAVSAVKKAKLANLPMGLHLNVTEGAPVSPAASIPSLVVDHGERGALFLGKEGFWDACRSNRVDKEDVAREAVAQIKRFLKLTGAYPRHVDGHQHAHVAPGVAEALAPVLKAYDVKTTRLPSENVPPSGKRFYADVIACSRDARPTYADAGIATTDFFVGMGVMGGNMVPFARVANHFRRNVFRARAGEGGGVFLEFMVHPGWVPLVGDGGAGGCGAGVDEFCKSKERETELEVLESPGLAAFFEAERFVLSDWSDLARRVVSNREPRNPSVVLAIVAALEPRTGNETSALRWRDMLSKYYGIVLVDTRASSGNAEKTLTDLSESCSCFGKRLLVLALNAKRAKRVLRPGSKIPYICIAGGTDVNEQSSINECEDILRNASEIVVFTNDMMKKIVSLSQFNEPTRANVSVVPQSIDIQEVSSSRLTVDGGRGWLRKKCNFPESCRGLLVLLPAGIRAVKDPAYLIDALQAWNSELAGEKTTSSGASAVKLVLIGPIRDEGLYESLKSRESDSFMIHEEVSRALLLEAIAEADVVVNTSVSEGMSSALLEAMAAETLVIARDIPANRELLVGPASSSLDCGILFQSPEDFVSVTKNIFQKDQEERRARLIKNAKSLLLKRHTQDQECASYREIVDRLVDAN